MESASEEHGFGRLAAPEAVSFSIGAGRAVGDSRLRELHRTRVTAYSLRTRSLAGGAGWSASDPADYRIVLGGTMDIAARAYVGGSSVRVFGLTYDVVPVPESAGLAVPGLVVGVLGFRRRRS